MDQVKYVEDSLKNLNWYGLPKSVLLGPLLNALTHLSFPGLNSFFNSVRAIQWERACWFTVKPGWNKTCLVLLPNSNVEMKNCSVLAHNNTAGNYMFKARRHWHPSGVFIVNFQHISHLVVVFLLLTLSR